MDIEIKSLDIGDLNAINKLLRQHLQIPYGSGNVIEDEIKIILENMKVSIDSKEQRYFVAYFKDQLIGCMGYILPDKEILLLTESLANKTIEIISSYVSQDFRFRGIGKKLLEAIEYAALATGKTTLVIRSGPIFKETGWGFYDKAGFQRIGFLHLSSDPDVQAMVWKKKLV